MILSGSLLLTITLVFYLLRKLSYAAEIEIRVSKEIRTNQQLKKEISERKEFQGKLNQAASVIENTNDGIIVTDPDGVIEQINPSFTASPVTPRKKPWVKNRRY